MAQTTNKQGYFADMESNSTQYEDIPTLERTDTQSRIDQEYQRQIDEIERRQRRLQRRANVENFFYGVSRIPWSGFFHALPLIGIIVLLITIYVMRYTILSMIVEMIPILIMIGAIFYMIRSIFR